MTRYLKDTLAGHDGAERCSAWLSKEEVLELCHTSRMRAAVRELTTDTPKRKPGRPVGTHAPPKYTARLNIYLTPEQLVELRRMASEAGVSASGLVRGKLGLE